MATPSQAVSLETDFAAPPVGVGARLRAAYRLAHYLSLDIVAGVLGASLFIGALSGVRPELPWLGFLALSTWLIYSADHLLDAARIRGEPRAAHHRFFRSHALPLAWVTAGLTLLNLSIAAQLPMRFLLAGLPLLLLIAMHLFTAGRRSSVPKEFTTALIYVVALWIPVWSSGRLTSSAMLIMAAHGAVALTNLLLISRVEVEVDRHDGGGSWATTRGIRSNERALQLSAVCALLFALAAALESPSNWPFALTLLVLGVAPILIWLRDRIGRQPRTSRTWADGTLLLFWLVVLGGWG